MSIFSSAERCRDCYCRLKRIGGDSSCGRNQRGGSPSQTLSHVSQAEPAAQLKPTVTLTCLGAASRRGTCTRTKSSTAHAWDLTAAVRTLLRKKQQRRFHIITRGLLSHLEMPWFDGSANSLTAGNPKLQSWSFVHFVIFIVMTINIVLTLTLM